MIKYKKIIYRIVVSVFVIFPSMFAFAQEDSLKNIETTVVGDQPVTVGEAKKIEYNPEIDPPKLNPPTLTYKVEDKQYKTKPEIVPSKPQGYNSKESERLYGNYTKIGYGMYKMPLLETYFHNTRSNNLNYGIRYNFQSGEYLKANQIFSDNKIKGHFAYNLTSLSKIKVQAGYERNRINWYGFNPDSLKFDPDSTKNIYNNFSAGTYYEKLGKTKTDFSFGGGLDYYFQNDKYGNKENYFNVKGDVKKLVRQHDLTVPLSITSVTFGRDTNYSRLFIDLNPRYFLDYGRLTLNLGFNSTVFYDSLGGNLYWYPYADFKIKIIENKLLAHMGIDGGVQQNTYASLIRQNPFIDTLTSVQHSNTKVKVFGGLWGSIGSKLAYGIEADYGNYLNVPFFLCDTTPLRKYNVIYDNVDIFNVKATIQFQMAEQFKATLEFNYHNYRPGDQLYYWNMPNVDAKLNLQYNYDNKFTARITTYYIGERFGKNTEFRDSSNASQNAASVTLPALVDFNVILEYRYNKMIGLFLNGSNLTNQAYQRWLNYPGYKLAILGGVAFTF